MQKKKIFGFVMILIFMVGLSLRGYQWKDQVLVDDEWHSMALATTQSLDWILMNFAVPNGFSSIPLNLFLWATLHTVGWSEFWIGLMSMVFGLTCIGVAMGMGRRFLGCRRAAALGLLIAISPLLIFYSRLSRPYSAVACFTLLAVFFMLRWIEEGRLRSGVGFGVCGVLAVYFHPFAAVAIGTFGLGVLVVSLKPFRSGQVGSDAGPSWKQVVGVLSTMALAGVVLMGPALVNSFDGSFQEVARQGQVQWGSWLRLTTLISGTASPIPALLFWVAAGFGIVDVYQRNPWFTRILLAVYPLQILALLISGPHSSHVGIVLARYSMPLLPITLLFVACGLFLVFERVSTANPSRPLFTWYLPFACILVLGLTGPLAGTYYRPNNFTNHGVFQHDYNPIAWNESFESEFAPPDHPLDTSIRTEELSGFYRFLRENPNGRSVVEYPMMIGDHFNPLYFYQWYHQRPVLVGYALESESRDALPGGGVYGNTYIDEVLNLVDDRSRLKFKNLVDMDDLGSMRARGAEYLIVHKRFEAELSSVANPPEAMDRLLKKYRAELSVAHEEPGLVVFNLGTNPIIPMK